MDAAHKNRLKLLRGKSELTDLEKEELAGLEEYEAHLAGKPAKKAEKVEMGKIGEGLTEDMPAPKKSKKK